MVQKSPEVDELILTMAENHREAVARLRNAFADNMPEGFEECVQGDMISYIVPFTRFPAGYHARPGSPLTMVSIASQKNHIALYHMALYENAPLLTWLIEAWAASGAVKLDIGKACVRFKNPDTIPFGVVAELARKVEVESFVQRYEAARALTKPLRA